MKEKTVTRSLLVVISSPSGGGKTTICRELLRRHPDYLYSVSTTTRPPRPNEKNGVDYVFMSEKEFQRRSKAGEFVETTEIYGHRYGTLKETVNRNLKEGLITLFDLDYNGAVSLKRDFPQAVTVFLVPPSLEVLRRRLVSRGTDSSEVLEGRFQEALKEVSLWSNYDYVVTNDELDSVVERIEAIIVAEGLRAVPDSKPRLLKELDGS
jgi:guanylate kinase